MIEFVRFTNNRVEALRDSMHLVGKSILYYYTSSLQIRTNNTLYHIEILNERCMLRHVRLSKNHKILLSLAV